MATTGALAIRRAAAQERLDASARALCARFGVEAEGLLAPRRSADPEVARIGEMERTAALLEAVLAAADPKQERDPGDMTIAEVQAFAGTATEEELRALFERESAGKARKGALGILDARLGELAREREDSARNESEALEGGAEQTAAVIDERTGEQTATVIEQPTETAEGDGGA